MSLPQFSYAFRVNWVSIYAVIPAVYMCTYIADVTIGDILFSYGKIKYTRYRVLRTDCSLLFLCHKYSEIRFLILTISPTTCCFHLVRIHTVFQSELPRPIPGLSVESDHGFTSRIYFDNADEHVTLTLNNVAMTPQKP